MPAEPSEPRGFAADFRVGEWLVEPSLDRLSRNGNVLHIRPQLTNLLVLLARHAGRTVSKDEILTKVWDGQFVAESGMTRCIAEIRQALGDDARDPKIVETITKRGYRLVAPVTFLEWNQAPSPSADEASGEPQAPEDSPPPQALEPSSGPEALEDSVQPQAGEGSPPPQAMEVSSQEQDGPQLEAPPNPPSVAPPPAPRRILHAVGWTLGSLLCATVLLVLAWGAAGWSRAPALSERDTVLLADVTNTTGDPAFDHTLRLALAMHLGQAPFLRILPASRVRSALTFMGLSRDQPVTGPVALELCRREGAAVLLAGSIARLGSHYAVGLEALGCSSGESIGRELLEVKSKDEVLTALGTAAGRLRRTLGESRASLNEHDVPIVQATTPSLEALKALSLGDASRDHNRLNDALMFYRRATDLDPQFAVAWARRGAAAHNVARATLDERLGDTEEGTLAFRKAYELRDRVSEPERFYILGHYYRIVLGDTGKAIETYKLWSRTYPGSDVPPGNLASLYVNTLGQYDLGLTEAREALRLSSSNAVATEAMIVSYLGTNRLAEARQALREAAGGAARFLFWRSLAFQMAFADNDTAAMQEHIRWASADPTATMVMTQHRALAAAALGRLRESRRLWAEAAGAAAKVGSPAAQAAVRLREAEAEALLGDPRAARAAAEAALAVDRRGANTQLSAAAAFALAGDAMRARQLLEEVGPRAEAGTCSSFVWQPVARALADAGSGRPEQALQVIAPTARFERGRHFGLVPLGVRASIERSAGRAKEAAATFRELLSLHRVLPASPWVASARLGLARALREAGDEGGSRAAYDAVIEWMKQADEDAPILIAARRERAALQKR